MKTPGNLHKKVVVSLVLLSLFTIMLIFAGNAFLSKKVLHDISLRNLSLARSIGTQAWYTLRRPAHSLEQLSLFLSNQEHSREDQIERIDALFSFSKLLEMVQIIDNSGHVREVIPYNKEQIGLDLSRQPFFIKAKKSKGIQWTDAFRSGQTESPIVTISIAFSGGVLVGHINLEMLSEITRVTFPDSNKFLCIIDHKGVIIAHSDAQLPLKGINLLNMKSVKEGLKGATGTFRDNYDSVNGLASVVPIKSAKWIAMVFQPEDEALIAIQALRSYAIVAIVLITLAGIAAVAFFCNMLLKPIETLTERTEAISLGEYDVRLEAEYEEFEALAESFNNMAITIGDREQEIFYESQLNKAQAIIIRTITETKSIETLSGVVHEWALSLTKSPHAIVKVINLEQVDPKHKCDCGPKYICYFHDSNNFNFPHSSASHGELWKTVFNTSEGFYSNDLSNLLDTVKLPENHFTLKRIISAPVIHQGEDFGHIIVANSKNDYTERDYKTLKTLADLLAVAVNRIRSEHTLISNERNMRKLRNYLSNIIDSMPSTLIGVDHEGKITQWNHKAELETGLSLKKAIGQQLGTVMPHLAGEMEQVRLAIKNRQEHEETKRKRYESGMTRYEDLTIYPLITNGIEGAVIRIDDVTSRVSLEQMMVQSEKMMSVGGLAAGMAHEINNPLAAILGQNRNLQRRLIDNLPKNISVAKECGISMEAMHEYLAKRDIPRMLDSIDESGNRAATIVSNMLSFSRKSEKRMGSHSIPQLMDKTIELASNDYDLKKEYDFRKIKIIRDYAPDLPEVLCEGNEVQQVFLNLLKNGAEAMAEKKYESGGPCFTLRVHDRENHIIVEIEDNGPGVDEKSRMRMFEPFYTTKEVGKGTGLGLSVSYFIINDQHSGSMKVESAPGEWTRFTIKLPVNGLK